MARSRRRRPTVSTKRKPGRKTVGIRAHTRGKRGPGDSPRVKVPAHKRREPR